jgi:hypothetical protein
MESPFLCVVVIFSVDVESLSAVAAGNRRGLFFAAAVTPPASGLLPFAVPGKQAA